MLHITNGDIVVENMRAGGLPGEYLPWRDVLHEGPVPRTATLEELSAIRGRYLAQCGYGDEAAIAADFRKRDEMLSRCADHEEVVLWFEHDLYDQLQLIQVLDWLAKNKPAVPVSLILVGNYPGIARFIGLGQLTPTQLVGLFESRTPVNAEHYAAAQHAWSAFTEPTPAAIAALLRSDLRHLRYLRHALLRLLDELPSPSNGLSRTERIALAAVAHGMARPREMFAEMQALEQHPFMGDFSFWRTVDSLTRGQGPLLALTGGGEFRFPPRDRNGPAFEAQQLELTPAGLEVLENRLDATKLRGIDRWLGGTQLRPGAVWRWNGEARRLLQP